MIYGLKYFHPSLEIDGYELAGEFVWKARPLLRNAGLDHGVSIFQGNLLEIELPRDCYDAFYSSRVLHYIDGKEAVLRKLHAALKVGGRGMTILPNSPWENGYIESFNAKLRDDLIDREIFYSLREAAILIEGWRRHYNAIRPHSSLGYRPPAPETLLWPARAGHPAAKSLVINHAVH